MGILIRGAVKKIISDVNRKDAMAQRKEKILNISFLSFVCVLAVDLFLNFLTIQII